MEVQAYGKSIDRNSLEDIEQAIAWYFNKCATDNLPPTVEGLAFACGYVRNTINAWERGTRNKPSEIVTTIKSAKEIISGLRILDLHTGTGNPIGIIFDLSNNHGYEREASNAATTININMAATPQQLEQKYQDVIDADYVEQKQLGE